CGKKIGPDPRNFNQRVSLGRNDLLIRTFPNGGGSSQGFGYTARALIERRVTSNWFVGTAVDIQQAKDYAPSHLLLYVRYSAAGWQGDMDLPPQPLVPYADW
ncbi:cellulose synthase subunit BcsC-related outer membrane protein, partial [Citrobacter amalonaticus]